MDTPQRVVVDVMKSILQGLTDAYDEAVSELPLEEAIEVAEGLSSYVESALMGLREDARAHFGRQEDARAH